jgi:hypothetical protein
MNKNNWHDANQLEYTLGELQTMFDTQQVADMLDGMVLDGYSAMSLGLIIDLIKQRCPEVTPEPCRAVCRHCECDC